MRNEPDPRTVAWPGVRALYVGDLSPSGRPEEHEIQEHWGLIVECEACKAHTGLPSLPVGVGNWGKPEHCSGCGVELFYPAGAEW